MTFDFIHDLSARLPTILFIKLKRWAKQKDVLPTLPDFLKTNGISRDRFNDSRPAWVVQDGNYISARWPGDVHTFAKAFVALLNES